MLEHFLTLLYNYNISNPEIFFCFLNLYVWEVGGGGTVAMKLNFFRKFTSQMNLQNGHHPLQIHHKFVGINFVILCRFITDILTITTKDIITKLWIPQSVSPDLREIKIKRTFRLFFACLRVYLLQLRQKTRTSKWRVILQRLSHLVFNS